MSQLQASRSGLEVECDLKRVFISLSDGGLEIMGAYHDGLSTHLLDPALDCGNWTDLQSKIAESCPQSLERLSEEVASSLAKLEFRFQSYITTDSFKRSLRRR